MFVYSFQVAQHLANTYGDRAVEVAKLANLTGHRWPIVGRKLHEEYPYLEAEVGTTSWFDTWIFFMKNMYKYIQLIGFFYYWNGTDCWDSLSWKTKTSPLDVERYRQTCNITCSLVDSKLVDHSEIIGASPVGAAPTTSSFSTKHLASMNWAKATARREEDHSISFGIWFDLY